MANSVNGETVASRLCSTCGICCSGVLFHRVRLQARDSLRTLKALGFKSTGKKKHQSILQPCPAHQGCQCSIYEDRPIRCQQFECRLLQAVASAEISEDQAAEKIRETRRLIRQVKGLLERSGSADEKKSLAVRFTAILAQPLVHRSDPLSSALRKELIDTYGQLEAMLKKSFRLNHEERGESHE